MTYDSRNLELTPVVSRRSAQFNPEGKVLRRQGGRDYSRNKTTTFPALCAGRPFIFSYFQFNFIFPPFTPLADASKMISPGISPA